MRLKTENWETRAVEISIARRFIKRHHYSRGAANTATYLHGLFPAGSVWDEECMGVAWWIPPTKSAALATYPYWREVLSLSRFAVHPDAPPNSCSFLLGHSMRMINRRRWPCFVTYADTWQRHSGAIYLATNWIYVGDTSPEKTYVLDGRMVGRKRGGKTLHHDDLIAAGAECVGAFARNKFIHLTPYAARRKDDSVPAELSEVQHLGAAPIISSLDRI